MSRSQWLAMLNTRELVVLLVELRDVQEQQPELAGEVFSASAALRRELLRRERAVPAG